MMNLMVGAIALGMAAWAFWATKQKPKMIRVERPDRDRLDERRGPEDYYRNS